jgi:integrase
VPASDWSRARPRPAGPRVVDLDAGTVAALRAYRAVRGALTLDLVRDSALVLSNLAGTHRHPERFSRRFAGQVAQARKAPGEEQLPVIRLHDLCHTHATLLLADGVPVKVVSERLGHANATITLTVYQHVHPGMGREAADRVAALLEGGSGARSVTRVSRGSQTPRQQDTPGS